MNRVLGKRTPVNISTDVVALPNSERAALLSSLPQGTPSYKHASGLEVSFLSGDEIKALRERLKDSRGISFQSNPRIWTADGVGAVLFSGQAIPLNGCTNQVGLRFECYARVHRRSTDLFATIIHSEAVANPITLSAEGVSRSISLIRTNLDIAVRLQVPTGRGVLLLHGKPGDERGRCFEVLMDPLQAR